MKLQSRHREAHLPHLQALNLKVGRAWAIKEALRTLWTCRQPAAVKRFFTRWYGRAVRSRLEPVKECGRHVETSSRRSRAYRAPVLILSPRRGPALYSVTVPSGFTTNSKGTDSYASNLV